MSNNQIIYGNNNIQIGGNVKIEETSGLPGDYTIQCLNCKHMVSFLAESCPKCGHPVALHLKSLHIQKIKREIYKIILILIGALIILYNIIHFFGSFKISSFLFLIIFIAIFMLATIADNLDKNNSIKDKFK